MARKRRLVLTFALAVLLPAGVLAFLGFRALRAEESIRRAEAEQQARALTRLAAEEVRRDLQAWLADERASAFAEALDGKEDAALDGPPPVVAPELAAAVERERPDLSTVLAEGEVLELERGEAARAMRVYQVLASAVENPASQGRLLARAARCAMKAADASARGLLEQIIAEHSDAIGESGAPLGTTARLQLMELGVDRERFGRETLAALRGEPAFVLFVLGRLRAFGLPVEDRIERARVVSRAVLWARESDAETTWFGPWAASQVVVGGTGRRYVFVRRPPSIPREAARKRLDEFARLGGIEFGVRTGDRWLTPAPASPEFEASVWEGLTIASGFAGGRPAGPSTRRTALLAGVVIALVAAMSVGFIATVRAVNRELRLAQLKSDFVSNVSHELRTPLTSVRMFSDLVANPEVDAARRREYAELLQREAARLSRLVERLLDFARLERGEQVYSFEVCDLREVVERSVRSFRSIRPDFEVRFEARPQPVRASADAQALEQALHNLLDNAAKYAHEQRQADVALRPDGAYARIEVRDRGPGIDPKDAPLLFEKFQRGSGPQVIQLPGTGLGLAIVRQIAEAHRGRARVESVPGQGSTFIIEIPLWRES